MPWDIIPGIPDSNADHTAVATPIPMSVPKYACRPRLQQVFRQSHAILVQVALGARQKGLYNDAELPAAGREVSELPSAEEAIPGDEQVHDEMYT